MPVGAEGLDKVSFFFPLKLLQKGCLVEGNCNGQSAIRRADRFLPRLEKSGGCGQAARPLPGVTAADGFL